MTIEKYFSQFENQDKFVKNSKIATINDSKNSLNQAESTMNKIHCEGCKDKGVNFYLANNKSQKAKLLRVFVIIFASICTVYVCMLSSSRYFNTWVQTVIERTDVHVSEIPFPSITICPVRGINPKRLDSSFLDEAFSLHNETEKQEFYLLLQTFNDVLWSPLVDYIKSDDEDDDNDRFQLNLTLKTFKNTTFFDYLSSKGITNHPFSSFDLNSLLFYVTFDCEEIFDECTWRRTKVSCCNIFRKIETYKGVCYAFNSLHVKNPIPTWPWVVSDSGLYTGLRVMLKRSVIGNFTERVAAMVHDPNEIGTSDIIYLNGDTVAVTVNPQRFTADHDIISLRPELRHCYFENEFKHMGKNRENCIRNCRLFYIERNCNCTFIFPKIRSRHSSLSLPMCRVSHLKCIHKHKNALLTTGNILGENIDGNEFSALNCKCYPNCNFIQYRTVVDNDNTGSTHAKNYIDLQVQYQQSTLFSYRSQLCFNLLDLIVSYGGIAGLFLGLSLVGIIELMHDFIVCWKLRQEQKKRLKTLVKEEQYENNKYNNEQQKKGCNCTTN